MYSQNLYLSDGTLLATGFVRVVHGGRGDYIELIREQFALPLTSKFNNKNWETNTSDDFYYY